MEPSVSGSRRDALKKTLTVASNAGLGNRLRVLLSGKAVAEATGRAFAMQWKPTAACGCAFGRLFQNEWNVHEDTYFDYRKIYDLSNAPWQSFPDWYLLNDPDIFVFHHSFLYQTARFKHHRALEERAQQYMRALMPVDPLARRIEEFRQRHFRSCMIGVHLRRGDLMHHHPDTTGGFDLALRQTDAWLDKAPDAGILLCTDEGARNPFTHRATPVQNIRARFKGRYGERVVWPESNLDRNSPQSIEDALVELWLLRTTQYFVGTSGSSFSDMAVFGRDIPFAQLGTPTESYRMLMRWLKRVGLHSLIVRLGQHEYGREVPYIKILHRNLRRLRIFFIGRY